MKKRSRTEGLASLFLVILVASFLAAYGCSGGGGDGGSAIQYTGVTTQATVDDTNSDDLTKGAYIGGSSGMMGLGAVSQSGVNDLPRYLNLTQTLQNAIIQVDVNAPEGIVEAGAIIQQSGSLPAGDCSSSTASYVISFNDQTGEFTGTLSFNGYCSEGVTLSGSASFFGDYDDVYGQFDSSFSIPFHTYMEIVGDEATLIVPRPFKPSLNEKIFLMRDGKSEKIRVKGQELYLGEVEDMTDAILLGETPRISLDDSRANVATILALLESARTNKPVTI